MKKIIFITIFLLIASSLYANNFKSFMQKNVGNYVEVFLKKRLKATPNSAILLKVLDDCIVLNYGSQSFVVMISEIQYVRIYPK